VKRVRVIGAIVVLAVGIPAAAAALAWWRVSRLLHDWAPSAVQEQSEGAYRLSVARVHFNPLRRRIGVDSILFTTDSARNAARSRPLAVVRIALRDCGVGGVAVLRLVLNRGFDAATFGCRGGGAVVDARRHTIDSAAAAGARHAFLSMQRGLRPPRYAPRVRIAVIEFPHLALDFRLPPVRDRVTRLHLSRLHWRMEDLVIDPADSGAASRPLMSRTVDFAAADFVAHLERGSAVRVGALRASLTDSSVEVRNVRFARSGKTAAAGGPYRRDSITTAVDRISVAGIDVGQFAFGEGVRARRVVVDSFRIDVTSDRRLPPNPARTPYRTPQQWIAAIEQSLHVDSVFIHNGEVSYREHHEGRARPGVLTFARIEAVATNVSHVVGRRTTRDPMTLVARAHLQHAGRLDVRFRVPLDARQFTLSFNGKLSAMPGTALNPFIEHVLPLRITDGQVAGITFEAEVLAGRARGTLTPVYTDLAVTITRGSGGLLGNRGVLGDAARGIASVAANWKVRDRNPDVGSPPLVGELDHAFASNQSLPGYLWFTLRDGLLAVVKK
jgi:hypothetical protein